MTRRLGAAALLALMAPILAPPEKPAYLLEPFIETEQQRQARLNKLGRGPQRKSKRGRR